MIFKDREQAAQLLLTKLAKYNQQHVVVAGIPRGAMPMASIIAHGLGGELTAVLVHKIPHPLNEELAIGSVGISGHVHWLPYLERYSLPESYIQTAAQEQLQLLKKRQLKYSLGAPPFKNRIVIIVDDGVATGATTLGAVSEVKTYSPQKLVLATPVASHEAAAFLTPIVDELITLDIPRNMASIGQFYRHFPQVSEEEVLQLFKRKNQPNFLSQNPD